MTAVVSGGSPELRTAGIRAWLAKAAVGRRAVSFALLVVFVLVWQLIADNWVKPVWISSPSLVWTRLRQTLADGTLATNTLATFEETMIGLALGIVLGVAVGILLAHLKTTSKILDPYFMGAYSLPRVALAPFFVLWFGIGLQSKVALVASIAFFPVLFNVRQGMQSIDSDLMDAMRSMRAGFRTKLSLVMIPSVLPWIVSAIKIAIGMALIGAVVGEMVGADRGLGWLVTSSINNFDMTGAVLSLIIMAVIAMILYFVMTVLERIMFRWRAESSTSSIVPM